MPALPTASQMDSHPPLRRHLQKAIPEPQPHPLLDHFPSRHPRIPPAPVSLFLIYPSRLPGDRTLENWTVTPPPLSPLPGLVPGIQKVLKKQHLQLCLYSAQNVECSRKGTQGQLPARWHEMHL